MSQVKVDPSSVPLATWGINKEIGRKVRELIAPKYDVVHTCTDPDGSVALSELPALFSGDTTVRPSNGVGTNHEGGQVRIPKVMAYGGGITPDLKQELVAAMKEKANGAPWADEIQYVEVDREKMLARLNGEPPRPEISAELVIEAMEEKGIGK